MSKDYIQKHFSDICANENIIEQRLISGDFTQENLIKENENNLQMCKAYSLNYIFIDKEYKIDIEL